MAITILRQTVIMLILMIVGVFCRKSGMTGTNTRSDLSKFVLQVVNPVMIFTSYQTELRSELVRNLLLTFVLSVGTFIVMIIVSCSVIRDRQERDTAVERFSAVYSNCGFMGIPLINAVYGMEGVFYLTAFITVFNLFVWTHGIIMLSGERDFRKVIKVFCSPTIIAILLGIVTFFMQIRLPDTAGKALDYIAALNTPLAMIVSGMTMADTAPVKMLKKPRVYYVCFLRLLLIPAIIALLLAPLNISNMVRMTVILAAAAPPAAMCTLQCIRYGKNSLYASELFTLGTVLSIGTLPLIAVVSEKLTNLIG